jgi:hypothetical protein
MTKLPALRSRVKWQQAPASTGRSRFDEDSRKFSMNTIRINSNLIIDEETFHSVFLDAFGFPGFYGKNMNAWIDCMGYLDEPAAEMSSVHVAPGEVLALVIDGAVSFRARCPALYDELVECAAFVNQRCVEAGQAPLLAITMHA